MYSLYIEINLEVKGISRMLSCAEGKTVRFEWRLDETGLCRENCGGYKKTECFGRSTQFQC
jgi:hypothetical protein